MMPKPKPVDEPDAIDLEQDLGTRPAQRVDADFSHEPTDANGDADDERRDENQAVQDPA